MHAYGPASAWSIFDAAGDFGGKKLLELTAQRQAVLDIRGCHDTGQEGQVQQLGFLDDRFIQAGGDGELRASIDGLPHLILASRD